jgi:hypothetical protein
MTRFSFSRAKRNRCKTKGFYAQVRFEKARRARAERRCVRILLALGVLDIPPIVKAGNITSAWSLD